MATKKIRVYELARELGIDNAVVVELSNELKIGVKSHSSSIDEPSADRVRRLADSRGLRKEIVVEPEPEPAPAPVAMLVVPDHEDALRRATWLARESLREARSALDERRPTAERRRAWQEAARRSVASAANRPPTAAGRRNGSG